MSDLTALDILVLLLVGGGAVLGLLRGFVTEILSLFAWVAAIIALKVLHSPVTDALTGTVVDRPTAASMLAFALIFLIVYVGGKFVARALGRRTRASVLGSVDRVLGLGFGAVKGLIGATLLFLAVTLVYDMIYGATAVRPDWIRESRTFPLLNASGRAIVDFVAARRGPGSSDREAEPERSR